MVTNQHSRGETPQYIGQGHLDRHRAEALMTMAGFDALLLVQPETIVYATGAAPGNVTKTRRMGAAFVMVPKLAAEPAAAIIGDFYAEAFLQASGIADLRTVPIWVDTADISEWCRRPMTIAEKLRRAARVSGDEDRPAFFDLDQGLTALVAMLEARGMTRARIGIEFGFVPHYDALTLFQCCPLVQWADATELVARLRMVKSPIELRKLTLASQAAEAGISAVIPEIRAGMRAADLCNIWEAETLARAKHSHSSAGMIETWASITIGDAAWGSDAAIKLGDIVKFDVGCVIDGYSSDGARTFCYGRPTRDANELFSIMQTAHRAAVGALQIGAPLNQAHQAAKSTMHGAGFDSFRRGHFGHSLGATLFVEEWPFIAATEQVRVEPNMVLAVEVPWYVRGLGALMIEDQYTVTENGIIPVWQLSSELKVL